MSSQIIELSTFNSKEINTDNSRWSNQFPPVVVNTGDIVQMKSAFIDTCLIKVIHLETSY